MKIEKIFTDAPNQKVIDNAIDCIDKGNIIIIPTDSVYAFAATSLRLQNMPVLIMQHSR